MGTKKEYSSILVLKDRIKVCTVQEREALRKQIEHQHVDFRFETSQRWIEIEAVPDGVSWIVRARTSDGEQVPDGSVNGDERLEDELADVITRAKAWLFADRRAN
jgi:hypothetical protein